MFIIIHIYLGVQESYFILMLEYLPVDALFFWEVYKNHSNRYQLKKATLKT